MDLKKEILKGHTKAQTEKIVKYVGNNALRFKALVNVYLSGPYRVTQRAAWPHSIGCTHNGAGFRLFENGITARQGGERGDDRLALVGVRRIKQRRVQRHERKDGDGEDDEPQRSPKPDGVSELEVSRHGQCRGDAGRGPSVPAGAETEGGASSPDIGTSARVP